MRPRNKSAGESITLDTFEFFARLPGFITPHAQAGKADGEETSDLERTPLGSYPPKPLVWSHHA